MKIITTTGRYLLLGLAWTVQYLFWVPALLVVALVKGALKIGALGILLLCVPIIGWIVLAVLLLRRPAPRPVGRSMWTPWGLPA